ncbi:MAG: PadR family transcriptional regulator [Methanobacteriota archaeon]|nr:MAG: PadR family transcriptional regulator [Euryarchaeota archaeon]
MWIGLLKINDKPISSVELIVLVTLSDTEFTPISTLMEQLKESTSHWVPERGTIYPVLHRLEKTGLIEKSKIKGKMAVRRTTKGTSFLRARFPEIGLQLEAVTKYFETIAESSLEIDPIKAKDLLEIAEKAAEKLTLRLRKLKEDADRLIEEEGWREIKVE